MLSTSTRASAAAISCTGCSVAPFGGGAVRTNATERLLRCAWSISSSSAALLSGQRCAAAQSSSTMTYMGPDPNRRVSAFSKGCATAATKAAAISKRRNSSQGGMRAGLSRSGTSRRSSSSGGKVIRVGTGGRNFSNHQISGSETIPTSAQGATTDRKPRLSTGLPRHALRELQIERHQRPLRRMVGVMERKAPAHARRQRLQAVAVAGELALVGIA